MKRYSLFAFLFLLSANLFFAQKPIYTKAKVTAVKVYRNSAELQNTVSFSIPSGISEIVIGNISEEINEKTIQIGVNSKNISILSSQFTSDYSTDFKMDTTNPQIKKVNDSIKIVENLISKNRIELDANKKAVELLDKNQTVLVGSNSSNVAQLTQLTEFYTNKRIELENKLVSLKTKGDDLSKKLSRLKSSLKTKEQKEAEEFADGVIVLKLMSPTAGNIKLNINYLTDNVSWKPYYEIKAEKISAPLDVTFKAIVKQNTGLDWKGVKLTLINGNSSRNNYAPTVSPWFIYARSPREREIQREEIASKSAAIRIRGMGSVHAEEDDVQSKELEGRAEGVVVGYAGFNVNANELNTSYDIDIPYDILSNNEDHLISLYQQKIPADYQYFTAPNYNREAYLLAKIKDFNKYNLVSAPASIIFENMYIGETRISPDQTNNEMNITLGNDPKISIRREEVQDKSGDKFLSSYREKVITYDLVIKNNKKEQISIEVKDRFPLSNNEAVKIEVLDKSGAAKDDEKGFLTWNIKLSPSETKKLRVSYKVRYPKDYTINGL
ncbi:MAG: DUF4139 domain-containing protein [Flavobacteriaceae bacterium]|nr:DUF4139 domain-containing protein [Flavobacteriaceae bacterium]